MAEPLIVEVLRPLDLLVLRFELRNLALISDGAGAPRLVREDEEEESFVVVHLPPQHVAEQPFTGPVDASQLPVLAGVSRPSRLAFRLPPNVTELPFTLAALLDWSKWNPSLVPAALPPEPEPFEIDPPPPSQPGQEVTFSALVRPAQASASLPTGTVTFSDAGTPLGTVPVDANGRATLKTAMLSAGDHEVLVSYQGDERFGPSSASIRHNVG